jgi:beta-galactosidase
MFSKISQLCSLFFLLLIFLPGCRSSTDPVLINTEFNFNNDWEFVKDIDPTISIESLGKPVPGVEWDSIRIPHTMNVEPLIITKQQWQGTGYYRKQFNPDKAWEGKHITLKFEGAMHEAEVYLNGVKAGYNAGGYLPFTINISDELRFDQENTLLVKLNNEDNPQIPPGKAIDVLDFNYYGGIYRDVYLSVKDPLRISDPIEAERIAAGGIMVSYEDVSESQAVVSVQADIENGRDLDEEIEIRFVLQDENNNTVAESTSSAVVDSGSNVLHTERLMVKDPILWSTDKPYLYTLTVQLFDEDDLIDSDQQKIGIRTFGFDDDNQFTLNGERLYLRGTNRHQEYPYIGYALSNEAQYRDAYKIKKAGFNFIRTAHYPPDPAFLEAADELGLLFMNAIPGWQFYDDGIFAERAFMDIRKMIRRDRNHPSIAIWEASLNESGMPEEFMERAHEIVKEELPFSQTYTSGWLDHAYDIFIPARQHSTPPDYWASYSREKPLLIAEYGDWEYYAQNAGFNQDAFEDLNEEERTSRQLRGDGQKRLAQQALNFQEAHNSNLKGHSFGDANWLMFDYNRGYAPDIESSGIQDIFRIPKFANYFYQSQADPKFGVSDTAFHVPMVYIANYWSDPDFKEVKVYSNTDEVILSLNDKQIARLKPDSNRISSHLNYPPFSFFPSTFTEGTLKAEAYIDGEVVARHVRRTPQEPVSIDISVDESGKSIKSGVHDVVFVYATIKDKNGTTVHEASNSVRFELEGDATLIGHNPITAEAGIASILMRVGETPGEITIKATTEGLETGSLTLISK